MDLSIPIILLGSSLRVLSLVFIGRVHLQIEVPSSSTVFESDQYLILSPAMLSPILYGVDLIFPTVLTAWDPHQILLYSW